MSYAHAYTCPVCHGPMSEREVKDQSLCDQCYGGGGAYGRPAVDPTDPANAELKRTGYMADRRRKAVKTTADPVAPTRTQQTHPDPSQRTFRIDGETYAIDALPKGAVVTLRGQGTTEFRICLPLSRAGYYGMLSPAGAFWSVKVPELSTVRPVRAGFTVADDVTIRYTGVTWEFRDPALKARWVPPPPGGQP